MPKMATFVFYKEHFTKVIQKYNQHFTGLKALHLFVNKKFSSG